MSDEPSSFLPPARRQTSAPPSLPAIARRSTSLAPEPPRGGLLRAFAPMLLVILAFVAVYFVQRPPAFVTPWLPSGRAAARIVPYAQALMAPYERPADPPPPSVCGKVATLDAPTRTVDASFHVLDASLRADDASQIGTVGIVSCGEVAIGRKGGTAGAQGFTVRCRVDLVHHTTHRWLGGLTIESEDLPAPMRRTGVFRGTRPSAAIARWIASLPSGC